MFIKRSVRTRFPAYLLNFRCKVTHFFPNNQRKCTFFAFFFKKIWSCQKKAVLLHPLSSWKAFDLYFGVKKIAEIAQLVEHDLAKVGVASSSLVFRSFFLPRWRMRFRCACREVCRFESCSGHKKDTLAQVVKLVYTLL